MTFLVRHREARISVQYFSDVNAQRWALTSEKYCTLIRASRCRTYSTDMKNYLTVSTKLLDNLDKLFNEKIIIISEVERIIFTTWQLIVSIKIKIQPCSISD